MGDVKRNRCMCKKCGDIIESTHRHHFVTCRCGAISADGGHAYERRVAKNLDDVEEIGDDDAKAVRLSVEIAKSL